MLIGMWALFIGFAAVISSYLADLTATTQATATLGTPNDIYMRVFLWIGLGSVAAGLITFLFKSRIKRTMT